MQAGKCWDWQKGSALPLGEAEMPVKGLSSPGTGIMLSTVTQ